jgi:ATP-dependent RNA helicase DDX21
LALSLSLSLQTKREADDVAAALGRSMSCEALHGDIAQWQREKTLQGFRDGRFGVMVATDVAARGLDIPNVDLVMHYDMPSDQETFLHRSGRTGRAQKLGTAILMYSDRERRTVSSPTERNPLKPHTHFPFDRTVRTLLKPLCNLNRLH